MKKEIRRFYELNEQQKLMEEFVKPSGINNYSRRYSEQLNLVEDANSLNESNQSIIALINDGEYEDVNVNEFNKSLKSGKRSEYLTDYTEADLANMNLYKIKGYNAGFALKLDGDIVSVHNNTGIRGLGEYLIRSAIRYGGNKLDHFDGFLTGFYEKLGFKVVDSDDWNGDYAPMDWEYKPIDIANPQYSIYAKEINSNGGINSKYLSNNLKHKIQMYHEGKPDVVYRKL